MKKAIVVFVGLLSVVAFAKPKDKGNTEIGTNRLVCEEEGRVNPVQVWLMEKQGIMKIGGNEFGAGDIVQVPSEVLRLLMDRKNFSQFQTKAIYETDQGSLQISVDGWDVNGNLRLEILIGNRSNPFFHGTTCAPAPTGRVIFP